MRSKTEGGRWKVEDGVWLLRNCVYIVFGWFVTGGKIAGFTQSLARVLAGRVGNPGGFPAMYAQFVRRVFHSLSHIVLVVNSKFYPLSTKPITSTTN